jgi:hypothetical protein
MSIRNLEGLISAFRALGAQRILCKRLAENDNTKQQIYLGGSFDALNVLPFGSVTSETRTKTPTFKATVPLSWMDSEGRIAPAPGAQLILYPRYPEIRLSGFLRGCPTAPSEHMRPIPAAERRHNNGPDGRLLFMALLPNRTIVAFLAPARSVVATEFNERHRRTPFAVQGVFLEVPLPHAGDPRSILLAKLRAIHRQGWHASCRMRADGHVMPYKARNGGGYTLEALFGIVPNGRAEPDFLGWELKACGSDRITLMTPEPDSGYYGREGGGAFVRKYGHAAPGDNFYFTGTHRAGMVCEPTGQRLTLRGFDAASGKITDVGGGIHLISAQGTESAGWSFRRLLEHWGRKHAAAAYVPYERSGAEPPEYRYNSPVLLGEGTGFEKFLEALASGLVVYDPGSKISDASTSKPRTKARSQFRIGKKHLAQLYRKFSSEPLS